MKVNMELSEGEAKNYFKDKPKLFSGKLPKKIKPIIYISIIGFISIILIVIMMSNTSKSDYNRGYNKAISDIKEIKEVAELKNQDLQYVWHWFLKRLLITLGYGLPLLFLIMAIVWLVHGSLWRLM